MNLLLQLKAVLGSLYRLPSLLREHTRLHSELPPGATLFYVTTLNQWRACEPLVKVLSQKHSVVVGQDGDFGTVSEIRFSSLGHRLCMLLLFPFCLMDTIVTILKLYGTVSVSEAVFSEIFAAKPHLMYWVLFLERYQPRHLIQTNDHVLSHRAFFLAGAQNRVITIYLQHANVTSDYPALVCDLAFLDGTLAAACYDTKRSDTTCFLTGAPRLAALLEIPAQSRRAIGVGVSLRDSMDSVIEVLDELVSVGVPIIVRMHPRHPAKVLDFMKAHIALLADVTFSDSQSEEVILFLRKISVLVAGNTSLHLEAALSGAHSFYARFSAGTQDVHGFLDADVAVSYKGVSQVEQALLSARPELSKEVSLKFFGTKCPIRASAVLQNMLEIIDAAPSDNWPPAWRLSSEFRNTTYVIDD